MAKQVRPFEELQTEWKTLYQTQLPEAARSNSPVQPKWPVFLDHCFARIILDHTVGLNSPWPSKLKSPAHKNMSAEQLEASISLGCKILNGKADLVELDNKSLELRGKRMKGDSRTGAKRKRGGEEEEEEIVELADTPARKKGPADSLPSSPEEDGTPDQRSKHFTAAAGPRVAAGTDRREDLTPHLNKIALSHKTPFQKKVLSLLCQIPRGRYTTYAAISKHLSSSPRAVGNAIRNNPFAPHVPCHRVLATGGGIGGFHGSWGRNGHAGLNDDRKRKLLREEGVRFDGGGKVVGGVWQGFQ